MKVIIILVLALTYSASFAQNKIEQGRRAYIDGVMDDQEWTDAKIFAFEKTEFVKAKVYVKHDGKNLLLAYVNQDIKDSLYIFPEIFIDTKLNKGTEWQSDDYWFHVSAQDCYAVGKREDYSKCRPDYLVWRASPNYPFGDTYEAIDIIEISIPFELLNISIGDSFGMCLSLSLYPGEIRLNHPKEAHEDKPNTWKEFVLK